jgi:flagellar protein FliO/FliZ
MNGLDKIKPRINRAVLGLFGFVFLSPTVWAQTSGATLNSSPSSYLLQILLSTALIIGLILALAWFFKRTGLPGLAQQEHLKVLAGLSVGTREKIVLIQVGPQQLLVGVTPGQITTLHTLEVPLVLEPRTQDFAQKLAQMLKPSKPMDSAQSSGEPRP